MGALTNLAAGAAAGYMQGKRMKKEDLRAEKMDGVYEVLARKALGDIAKPATTDPAAPAPAPAPGATPNLLAPQEKQNFASGGMVGGCLPMGDRMGWQRQNFKK